MATSHSVSRRPYTSPADRVRWIERFQQSGLSQRAFAQRHRLGLSTLRNWLYHHRCEGNGSVTATAPPLQEVSLHHVLGASSWVAEVIRPGGAIVRISAGISTDLLDHLLRSSSC